jgi:amidase
VQAGYDARVPLASGDSSRVFEAPLDVDLRGKRIAWLGDFRGAVPYERGVLDVCRRALRIFEELGLLVEEAAPEFPVDRVWEAWLVLRAWQGGGTLLPYYRNPQQRQLLKPEAIFEIESGLKLTAYDITAASLTRTEWYHAVWRLFERYDYLIVPTAQLFPFDNAMNWPAEIAGRRMATYHEWMKGVIFITMSGCPALAVPAGFNDAGLPIGIQIVGRNQADMACLQLAHAYAQAADSILRRLPPLLA